MVAPCIYLLSLIAAGPIVDGNSIWDLAYQAAGDSDKQQIVFLAEKRAGYSVGPSSDAAQPGPHRISVNVQADWLYAGSQVLTGGGLHRNWRRPKVNGLQLVLRNVAAESFEYPSQSEEALWKAHCSDSIRRKPIRLDLEIDSLVTLPDGTLSADLIQGSIAAVEPRTSIHPLKLLVHPSPMEVAPRAFFNPSFKHCETWALLRKRGSIPPKCIDAFVPPASNGAAHSEFEHQRRKSEAENRVAELRKKLSPSMLRSADVLLYGALFDYSFDDRGYRIEVNQDMQIHQGIAIIQEAKKDLLLKVSPDFAEREVAWRRRSLTLSTNGLPVFLIVTLSLKAAYMPEDSRNVATSRPSYRGGPLPEIVVDIQGATVISEDGYILGSAKPAK
jgi:hypothetical protein